MVPAYVDQMRFYHLDSCTVNNGGCDANAACTHDASTNAVVCTCKTGYTNVGTNGNVVCQGKIVAKHCLRIN